MHNLTRLTRPEDLPVDLDLARRHCRLWDDSDDLYLMHLIQAAQAVIEGPTGIGVCLLKSDWLQTHSKPMAGRIDLPLTPVYAVTKVEISLAGVWSEVATGTYVVNTDVRPAYVEPISSWPTHDALRVTHGVGYGDETDALPADLKAAIFMLVAHWYENRSPLDAPDQREMPFSVTTILNRYRV